MKQNAAIRSVRPDRSIQPIIDIAADEDFEEAAVIAESPAAFDFSGCREVVRINLS